MKKSEITNKEIHDLILELGLKLADHNHEWSNELRKKFEDVTTYLSRYPEYSKLHQVLSETGGYPVKSVK